MGELGLRERKKLRTRETIATVALDLFAERGYQQTTVAEIAEAAEVSKGTLFAYFPSKEEIVFADTSPLRDQLCHELRHRSKGLSAVDTLRGFVADHMVAPAPRELLRERLIAENEQLRMHYRARLAEVEDALAEAIAADLGEPADGPRPRFAAAAALSAISIAKDQARSVHGATSLAHAGGRGDRRGERVPRGRAGRDRRHPGPAADGLMEAAHEQRQHYGITFATLAVAAIVYALLQSLVAPALPAIQADLNASATGATWILTAYLLSACVATPIVGRLGDMFGKKKMLVITLWVLALGTLLAALSSTIALMTAARVMQGIGGAVFPLAFSIIRDEFPRERIAHGIAMISALVGIGGGLGIVLSGPIVQHLNYHWLFWLPLAAIVPVAVITMVMIPESPIRTPGQGRLGRGRAARRLAGGAAGRGQRGAELGLGVGGHAGPAGGVRAGRGRLGGRRVADGRAAGGHDDAARPAGVGDEPVGHADRLWHVRVVRADPAVRGDAEIDRLRVWRLRHRGGDVPAAGHDRHAAGGPGGGPHVGDGGLARAAGAGRPAECVAWVQLALLHSQSWQIYTATFVMGLGIGLAFASMVNVIVESVRPDQTGVATGMNVIFRNVGGALGGQISASILTASVVAGALPTAGRVRGRVLAVGRDAAAGLRSGVAGSEARRRAQRRPRRAGTGAGRGLTQAPAGRRASIRSVHASTLSMTRCVPLQGSRASVSRTSSAEAATATWTTRYSSPSGPPRTMKPASTRPSMNAACSSQPDCCSSGNLRS